jgi:hypothetical protein
MSRFAVDPESLTRLAASVRGAAEEADAVFGEHRSLGHAVAALRDPQVMGALNEFVDRWTQFLRSLLDDAHRLADGADLAARLYRDAELAAETALPLVPLPDGLP